RERAGLNTGNASLFLSNFYNTILEPESGYEWACMAEAQFKSRPYLINRAILAQIWSLILLNQLSDAETLIDASRESILKSGDETQLAWLHFVNGMFDMEHGDYSSASNSIEQALRIYEQQDWSYETQLNFLYHLAKIEVYACDTRDIVSPSLAILEDKALSEDLPGVLGQVLLLKADIALMEGDDSNARRILQELRFLSKKENLLYMYPLIDRMFKKIS
ncbi:MAG: hypothetical protein ACFFD6_10310, partial [Candidatus Thorarchaeota archaeon]